MVFPKALKSPSGQASLSKARHDSVSSRQGNPCYINTNCYVLRSRESGSFNLLQTPACVCTFLFTVGPVRRRPVNSSGSAKWPSAPHSCTAFPRPSGYKPAQIKPESFHDQGNVRGRWELEQRARPGNCCQLWYVDAKDGRRLESCPVSSGLRASTPSRGTPKALA